MKANELMIGDWVTSRKWIEKPFRLINVTEKKGDFFYGRTAEDSIVGPFFIEELEPIPLTPEILEKNGWEKDDDGFYEPIMELNEVSKDRKGESIWIEWSIEKHELDVSKETPNIRTSIGCMNRVYIVCEFVHELQHALNLCGIEKEIIL